MTISLGPGPAVVAIDVGGTDTKIMALDEAGVVRHLERVPTPHAAVEPAQVVVDAAAAAFLRMRSTYPQVRFEALGLGVPGDVDEEAGVAVYSANLGWRDAPMRALLAERVDVPVAFSHDVRAAGRTEHVYGAAQGARDAVVLAIGTGIAGALILDGRLYAAGGAAGELGHALADPAGERCACGAVGCLETIASAGAIARRYAQRSGREVHGAREVLLAKDDGDAIAAQVWDEAVIALAEHIARLAAIIAPEVIVVGGGLAQAGEALLAPVREHVAGLLSFHRHPRIELARVGEDAGVLGVAIAARAQVRP